MQATTIHCPRCQGALRLPQTVPPGSGVGCPTCGTVLHTPAPAQTPAGAEWWVGAPQPVAPPPPAPQQVMPRAALQALPPQPVVSFTPPPAAPRPVSLVLIFSLLGGGLVVLAGGLLLLVVVLSSRKKKDVATAETTERAPTVQHASTSQPSTRKTREDDEPVRAPRIERNPASAPGDDPSPLRADPPPAEKPRLPPEEQARVDKAIEKGLEYLSLPPIQSLNTPHALGHASLLGLTMLECGVPADDPRVQRMAAYVRTHAPNFSSHPTTYQVSLAILFLDRLGEPRDELLIRNMGLRLVAGQGNTGGWTYQLPLVQQGDEEKYFLYALRANRPRDASGRLIPIQDPLAREERPGANPGNLTRPTEPGAPANPMGLVPGPVNQDPARSEPDPEAVQKALSKLPPTLRRAPALPPTAKGARTEPNQASDNSNTQFATLALWVAGRHGVPIERSMMRLGERFRVSQGAEGNWGYHYENSTTVTAGGPGAMTGAGLLGLAAAHGVTPDRAPGDRKGEKDPHIQKGLQFFGQYVGKPLGVARGRKKGSVNLYYLWTMERVAVLYKLETLNGQDWYAWGAELLVDNQEADGHWPGSNYPGSEPVVDTCFALLFLKRANLAKDLSRKLEFLIEAKDPGSGR